jgi:hypothetical protein
MSTSLTEKQIQKKLSGIDGDYDSSTYQLVGPTRRIRVLQRMKNDAGQRGKDGNKKSYNNLNKLNNNTSSNSSTTTTAINYNNLNKFNNNEFSA